MTIIEDKELTEKYFKEHLDEIRIKGTANYKHSSNDVWGKEVRFLNKENKQETHMLENWYIDLIWDPECDIDTLIKQFQYLARKKELEKIQEVKDNKFIEITDNEELIIEQLCDWQFLENEKGQIIRNDGTITLVKYAAVVVKNCI